MTRPRNPMRLHRQMAGMVAMEHGIGRRIEEFLNGGIEHPETLALLEELRLRTSSQRHALADRLASVAPNEVVPDAPTMTSPIETIQDSEAHPASSALVALQALFGQAVTGYAILMELAFRAADSSETVGPDNTGDIATDRMRTYAAAAQEIIRLLPFVIADELDYEGLECRCVCPMCGLGVCGCPLAFRRRLGVAWADAGPIEMTAGIRLARPRTGSPAAEAGLERGDVIVGVEGRDLESLPVLHSLPLLQETIGGRSSGEPVRFQVQRSSGGRTQLTVTRS